MMANYADLLVMRNVNLTKTILVSFLLYTSAFAGVPIVTTFQARIFGPTGATLEAASVNFRFTILDSSGTCPLYVEDYAAVNMSGSQGIATFSLGSGAKVFPAGVFSMVDVFNNAAPSFNCQAGGTYLPNPTDRRQVVMQFNDGSGWQTVPQVALNSVFFANYANRADNLGNYPASDYLRPVNLPTCAGSQALSYDGTSFSCIAAGGGAGGITSVTGTLPVVISGATSTPVVSMAKATAAVNGYLSSADWTTFNAKASGTLNSGQLYLGNGTNAATGVTLSGDATLANTGVMTLVNSGVTAATYGSANAVPALTIDAKGRVTSATSYGYQDATGAGKGIVQIGTNLTVSSGVLSMMSSDISSALGYTPANSTNSFNNGGNAFLADSSLGATSNFGLNFKTNNLNRMTIDNAGNVGIGTAAPNASSLLELSSSAKGILIPRMTAAQRDAITSTATGLQVYNTDSNQLNYYNGSAWATVGAGSGVGGSGTTGKIPKFTAASTLGDSLLSESGSTLTLNGLLALPTTTSTAGQITVNGSRFMHAFGTQNTFLGSGSGSLSLTGNSNTGIGSYAMALVTSASQNTAVGYGALYWNDTGFGNTAIGGATLTGTFAAVNRNTAVGDVALSNTTSDDNVGVGYYSLQSNTSGTQNTALGTYAGQTGILANANTTGSNNTYVGYGSGPGTSTQLSNSMALGSGSRVTASNQVVIGNISVVQTLLNGNVGIGVTSPQAALDVVATGVSSSIIVPRDTTANRPTTLVNGMIRYNTTTTLFEFYQNGGWVNYTTVSDGRLKTNVEPVSDGLRIVNQLNPVFYDWNRNNSKTSGFEDRHQVGFIAQEVEKVLPEVVNKGEDGYRSLEYGKMVSVVIAAVKELYNKVLGIDRELASVKAENAELKAKAQKAEQENAKIKAYLCEKDPKAAICK